MQPIKIFPLIALASLLSACGGGSMEDLEQFISETKQAHHGAIEPIPIFPEFQTFAYAADDSRDPFAPQTELTDSLALENYSGPRPEPTRQREPLESYPVDALEMVGLLQQRKQTWGLVRDPDGAIHRVQPGNYAGKNHGKIIQVSETNIQIVELVPDGLSGWINRDAQLAMAED